MSRAASPQVGKRLTVTPRIGFTHGVHEFDDDPSVIEGGESRQPLVRSRCVGERLQHAPAVDGVDSTVLPLRGRHRGHAAGCLRAPHFAPLDGERGMGSLVAMERAEPHVPHGKEQERGLTGSPHLEHRRRLGDQLSRPRGTSREGAGDAFHGAVIGLRGWHGCCPPLRAR